MAVALFAAAAERAARVKQAREAGEEREAHLKTLLRRWPLVTVAEIDPYELGVFPSDVPPAQGSVLPAYVERDADEELRSALAEHPFILIFGPTNAGKSRSAYEGAKKVLGDKRVSVPEDGEALRELLELSLDRGSLDKLAADWPRCKVVATMREADYRKLYEESGGLADAGKRILRRARTVHLGTEPSRDEQDRAHALYPAFDVRNGIGQIFAADWRAGHAPPPPQPAAVASREPPRRHVPLRPDDRRVAIYLGLFGLICLLGGALWVGGAFDPPKSESSQLADIRSDAARSGQRVVFSKAFDLRGTGEKSRVLVLRDRLAEADSTTGGAPAPDATRAPRSDQLQIYDKDGPRFSRTFDFRPRTNNGRPYFLRVGSVRDLDDNGSEEIIAGYARFGDEAPQPIPVTVFWDEDAARYKIEALQTAPPRLRRVTEPGSGGEKLRASYHTAVELTDQRTVVMKGYPVKDFVVVDGRTGPKLVTSFVTRATALDSISDVEIQAWSLAFESGHPRLSVRCVVLGAMGRPLLFHSVPKLPLPNLLAQIWKRYDVRALC